MLEVSPATVKKNPWLDKFAASGILAGHDMVVPKKTFQSLRGTGSRLV
jgi:hypothetical protein